MQRLKCFSCHTDLEYPDKVGFRAECGHCGADVHCCKNCRFYDPKVYNECKETSADVVREKDRANYCEFYQPAGGVSGSASTAKEDLLNQAEALFKKK